MSDSGSHNWAHPAVILVATDLSDLDRLMPFAMKQAGETGARLILLHVLASVATLSTDAAGLPYYDTAGALEIAEKALNPWCEQAQRKNIACDAVIREGNPMQQIAAAVHQFHVDRILVGTRSRSKLGKLLIGSVAEQVLRSVNLPVVTVGPEAHLPVDSGEERIVLHATTLRETSRLSAALACSVAASQKARLVLLHVLPPSDEIEGKGLSIGQDAVAMRELHMLAAETGAGCCSAVEPVVIHGNPSIEILAMAAERHAGMIVLGSTQRSAFENLTRDRTVYRVLAHACCPVLTLRETQDEDAELDAKSSAMQQP
jgi:nucleotide-binding universal stress UspA family protein